MSVCQRHLDKVSAAVNRCGDLMHRSDELDLLTLKDQFYQAREAYSAWVTQVAEDMGADWGNRCIGDTPERQTARAKALDTLLDIRINTGDYETEYEHLMLVGARQTLMQIAADMAQIMAFYKGKDQTNGRP